MAAGTASILSMEQQILQELAEIKKYTLLASKDTFNLEEAALYMGLSKNTIYDLVSRREITSYRSGGGKIKYFRREDLDRWMLHDKSPSNDEIEAKAALHCLRKKN